MHTSLLARLSDTDRNIYVVFAGIFFFACGFGLITFIYPLYAKNLGATSFQVGIIYFFSALIAALSSLVSGFKVQKYELKKYILITNVLIVPGAILYLVAFDWKILLLAELFIGLSFAVAPALSYYVHLKSKLGEEGWNFGIMGSAFPLGLMVTPAAGGFIADRFGFSGVFIGCLFFYMMSAALFLLLEKQNPKPVKKSTAVHKIKKIFSERRLVMTLLLFSFLIFIDTIYAPFFPIYLKEELSYSFSSVGIIATVIFAVNALLTPVAGRYADKFGVGKVLSICLFGYGLSIVIIGSLQQFPWILSFAIMNGIFRHIYTLGSVATARNIKHLPGGLAYGMMHFSKGILGMLGPLVGGLLDEASHVYPLLVSGFAFVAISLLLFSALKVEKKYLVGFN